ncbi:MAG: 30S ribosomal protein S6 [Proteobacteria bacterium]|nr:30S ribosomal protein S6 [Pseudomonadota bacterium]
MPYYEHVIIARPDINAQQVEAITQDFTKIVEKGGAKVTKSEYWGLRTLAYKIKKNRKAHYMFLNIDGPHPAIAEMERLEHLNEDILRFMTIRVDELEEGPSIMMQARTDRRPRRDDDRRPPRRDAPAPAATAPAAKPKADAEAPKADAEAPKADAAAAPKADAAEPKAEAPAAGDDK